MRQICQVLYDLTLSAYFLPTTNLFWYTGVYIMQNTMVVMMEKMARVENVKIRCG